MPVCVSPVGHYLWELLEAGSLLCMLLVGKASSRKDPAGLSPGWFLLSWVQNCITGTSLGESGKDISFVIFSITSFHFFLSPGEG